jgi:hypothetical protein
VSVNDWIIQGVKGELYPCRPDIFEATYEPEERPQVIHNKAGQPCLDLSRPVDADGALTAIGKCVETIIAPKNNTITPID